MSLNFDIRVGRPQIGLTKKVSITLPEEVWHVIEQLNGRNKSAYFRELVAKDFQQDSNKGDLIKAIYESMQEKGDHNVI